MSAIPLLKSHCSHQSCDARVTPLLISPMEIALPNRLRFGPFELDVRSGELASGRRRIVLQEQPLRVLLMLVAGAGELVTRDEIQSKLWPNDTVVEFDAGINAAVRKLRQALEDSAENPKYIE